MDRYCLTTTRHIVNNGGWVRYEDAQAEIAELKYIIAYLDGRSVSKIQAEAIREMVKWDNLGNTLCNRDCLELIEAYADELEKGDG